MAWQAMGGTERQGPQRRTDLVPIAIGTAGWSLRSENKPQFPSEGTQLEG
jgi:hypothetical protein